MEGSRQGRKGKREEDSSSRSIAGFVSLAGGLDLGQELGDALMENFFQQQSEPVPPSANLLHGILFGRCVIFGG